MKTIILKSVQNKNVMSRAASLQQKHKKLDTDLEISQS